MIASKKERKPKKKKKTHLQAPKIHPHLVRVTTTFPGVLWEMYAENAYLTPVSKMTDMELFLNHIPNTGLTVLS